MLANITTVGMLRAYNPPILVVQPITSDILQVCQKCNQLLYFRERRRSNTTLHGQRS
jgi:hypothetical protein